MKAWLILVFVGLTACGNDPPVMSPKVVVVDQPRKFEIPKNLQSCDTTVPSLSPPVTAEKTQGLLDAYDSRLTECAGKVDKIVTRARRFNRADP